MISKHIQFWLKPWIGYDKACWCICPFWKFAIKKMIRQKTAQCFNNCCVTWLVTANWNMVRDSLTKKFIDAFWQSAFSRSVNLENNRVGFYCNTTCYGKKFVISEYNWCSVILMFFEIKKIIEKIKKMVLTK